MIFDQVILPYQKSRSRFDVSCDLILISDHAT